ncbi:MAG: histidine kinase [Butyrivibrio sp.]|nr:histidine kinase [Butyrivibrio sp.]
MTLKDLQNVRSDRKRTLWERILNMSIKYKIAVMTFFVALIPMTVLIILMLFFYNRAILQRADKQIEENIRIMSDRISSVLQNGEVCSNNLTIEISGYYNDRAMKQVTRDNKIISQLSQSLLLYNGISSIVFIDDYERMFTTDPNLYAYKADIFASDYVKELSDKNGKTYLMDISGNPMSQEGKDIITLGKRVINVNSGSPFGYIFINMNKDYLVESSKSEISYYFLYDTSGVMITESSQKGDFYSDELLHDMLYLTDEKSFDYDKEKYLVARGDIPGYPWTIIGITNLNKFNVTGKDLRFILFLTGSVTAILLLFSVHFSTNFIIHPLKILHDGAEQIAEGDMSFRFRFRAKDEIGRLGRIFNYMTQAYLELLKKVDAEAKKKREYELALIQEQVKPHFLYNTLDIIIMLIEMNRSKEASRVTKKLANYYKNSLSGSEEIVTIEREIQIIQDYLDLQTMRYADKFTYVIDVEDEIKSSLIPKMTLQPLVENAIYHGLKNKSGSGKIEVVGKAVKATDSDGPDSYAEIYVIDDGIGMPAYELDSLNRLLSSGDDFENEDKKRQEEALITDHDTTKGGSHFGLYSVARRIKLYFGKEYGAGITSKENEGTTVTVRVPYEKKESR